MGGVIVDADEGMATDTEVLVLGGGSTGCGIARDLARRGLEVTLVERGTLTDGTTGRMHGLLHSGGRYAVSDRASARECIEENEVLREIAGHCVEETGGLFVQRPGFGRLLPRNSRAVVSVGSPLACSRARKPARSNRTSRRT